MASWVRHAENLREKNFLKGIRLVEISEFNVVTYKTVKQRLREVMKMTVTLLVLGADTLTVKMTY
jgi:hypothetical protein